MRRKQRRSAWRYLKPVVDALWVVLAFGVAYWVRYELQWVRQVEPAFLVPLRVYLPSIGVLTGILLTVYWLEGAYSDRRGRSVFEELSIVFRGTLIGIAGMIVLVFLLQPSYYSRLIFGYAGIATVLLVSISRIIERTISTWRHRRGLGVQRVLIVGCNEVARSLMRTVVARPDVGYQIVGFVDDDPTKSQTDIGRFPALGTVDKLHELLVRYDVDQVIITLPLTLHRQIFQIMALCERFGVQVCIVPDLFQMALSRVEVGNLDGIPLLSVREPSLRDWQIVLKRGLDVIISAACLVLLAPVMLGIAIAIKLDSEGPVIFRQTRVGKGGRHFTVFKFRSMCVSAEQQIEQLQEHNQATGPIFKIRNDPRCTRVGRILRRASLDELPQFWNVLRGDMSLIGPRPPLPSEVETYEPWHLRRLEASPGITGLWQVSGRSDLTFDEMVLLDVYYIENWSPFLDLRILARTLPTVLLGSGAY